MTPLQRVTMTTSDANGQPPGSEPVAEFPADGHLVRRSPAARFRGVAVSPGVAIARAQCLHDIPVGSVTDLIDESKVVAELARFEDALQRTAADLEGLRQKVAAEVGDEEAAIFTAHLAILRDSAFLSKVQRLIAEQRFSATAALQQVAAEYMKLLDNVADEYLKERVADLRDIVRRLSDHVVRAERRDADASAEPIIFIANELFPSDVPAITETNVAGIVTATGSRTSHAGILARSYGIPAVCGVSEILKRVAAGDTVIVDGSGGHVFVNPSEEILRAYRTRRQEFAQLKTRLAAAPLGPVQTADGETLELLANVNCAADLGEAASSGATGVGLYRTEFFFLTHPNVPGEDEQTEHYRKMMAAAPGRSFTVRTLDLGGDKTIPYLTHAHEANPFMGWRSIRLSFEHPEFFESQIRAVLRAAAEQEKEIRLLFPMITATEELQSVHKMLRRARRTLGKSGKPCGKVRVGMMVEVPAAAIALEMFLEDVDFVSIGSNDLVQYLTAADRDNPRVNHLCQALSPAVLRVLGSVVETCDAARKPVTLCGEMAGSPRAFILLVGLGLRSFSMSPAFIPPIHDVAARLTIPHTQAIFAETLRLRTAKAINAFMDRQVEEICPHLKPLLTA
jgi:phosphotransferase system enzyme I (PtsI)